MARIPAIGIRQRSAERTNSPDLTIPAGTAMYTFQLASATWLNPNVLVTMTGYVSQDNGQTWERLLSADYVGGSRGGKSGEMPTLEFVFTPPLAVAIKARVELTVNRTVVLGIDAIDTPARGEEVRN